MEKELYKLYLFDLITYVLYSLIHLLKLRSKTTHSH